MVTGEKPEAVPKKPEWFRGGVDRKLLKELKQMGEEKGAVPELSDEEMTRRERELARNVAPLSMEMLWIKGAHEELRTLRDRVAAKEFNDGLRADVRSRLMGVDEENHKLRDRVEELEDKTDFQLLSQQAAASHKAGVAEGRKQAEAERDELQQKVKELEADLDDDVESAERLKAERDAALEDSAAYKAQLESEEKIHRETLQLANTALTALSHLDSRKAAAIRRAARPMDGERPNPQEGT